MALRMQSIALQARADAALPLARLVQDLSVVNAALLKHCENILRTDGAVPHQANAAVPA